MNAQPQVSPDASPSRRGFLVAAVGGAAGAVAVLLGRPAEVRADHATGGNFSSTIDAPAVHAVNTGGGVALVAERTGSGGFGKRPAVEMHNSSVDEDAATLLADRSGSSAGSAIQAVRTEDGDGSAIVASRIGGGHGSAIEAVREGTGSGGTIGAHNSSDGVGQAINGRRDGNGLGSAIGAVRGGPAFGDALVAIRFAGGPGVAVNGIAGLLESDVDAVQLAGVPGTGVRGVGSAVGVRAEGPIGLSVVGRPAFSTVGAGAIPAGANQAIVAQNAVRATSHVSVTFVSNPPNNTAVAWIDRNPGVGFTVRLTKNTAAAIAFTYMVVEPV